VTRRAIAEGYVTVLEEFGQPLRTEPVRTLSGASIRFTPVQGESPRL